MEILGIGVGELFFIVLLILILFGPKDMVSTGRNMGRWLNRFVNSTTYKLFMQTGEELRNLPRNLMREANLEEYQKEMQQIGKDVNSQVNSIGGSLANSLNTKPVVPPPPPASAGNSAEKESSPEVDNPTETPKTDEAGQ